MSVASRFLSIAKSLALLLAAAPGVALASEQQDLGNYMVSASHQGRPYLVLDPIIASVAQAKAEDMANRNYFEDISPEGYSANYMVQAAGYLFPCAWGDSPTANYIQSMTAGATTAGDAWTAFMNSPPHKEHLLAQNSFYASETHYGVGYAYNANSYYKYYWVIITVPPQPIILDTPAAHETITLTGSTQFAGTTAPADGVQYPDASTVQYRVKNSSGTSAWQSFSGTKTWSGEVTGLAPWENLVTVESVGSQGEIAQESRTIIYKLPSALTVTVSGSGTVTRGFLGTTTRDVGASITIRATPSRGSVFLGWSGSVSGTNPLLAFTMQAGESLQANFEANPYGKAAGNYDGLLSSGSDSPAGFFKATLGGSGLVTGRVTLDGKSYAFSGRLTPEGAATITIKRPGLTPLTLSLQCDFSTGQMTGTLTEGTDPLAVSAGLADYNAKTNPFQYAGKYCLVLLAGDEGPRPNGSALLTVTKGGSASLTGTMGGGSRFTCTAAVTSDGLLPVWFVPGGEALGSYVAGYLGFTNNLPSGTLVWYDAPKKNASLFPVGFITELPVTGQPK